ncbi:hypothetical protein [Spirosoma sp. KUDC1026]|nr:hypothetical protein [Spirosoma sp. KUDC1026]
MTATQQQDQLLNNLGISALNPMQEAARTSIRIGLEKLKEIQN